MTSCNMHYIQKTTSCHLSFITTLRKIHKPKVPHQSSFWQNPGTTSSRKINTDVPHSGNWRGRDGTWGMHSSANVGASYLMFSFADAVDIVYKGGFGAWEMLQPVQVLAALLEDLCQCWVPWVHMIEGENGFWTPSSDLCFCRCMRICTGIC